MPYMRVTITEATTGGDAMKLIALLSAIGSSSIASFTAPNMVYGVSTEL